MNPALRAAILSLDWEPILVGAILLISAMLVRSCLNCYRWRNMTNRNAGRPRW